MSWKLKLLPAGLLAALGVLASASPAAAWDVVGQRTVCIEDAEVDNDLTISVRGHRQYRQIKLCVDGNPVHFRDLRINFRNGGHQDVTIGSQINAGECTRVIDLEDGARNIMNTIETREYCRTQDSTRVRVYAQ